MRSITSTVPTLDPTDTTRHTSTTVASPGPDRGMPRM
jgi:hypothetical protein